MSKPHILILAPFSQKYITELSSRFDITHSSWLETMKLRDPDEMAILINQNDSIAVVIESDFIFEETLKQVESLKFIGICRSAINHVDIDAATKHRITVVNSPARNARAVAEYVLSVILDIARKTTAANNYVHSGMWNNPIDAYIEFRGTELKGKTLGLLGIGGIGREIAKLMYKLDMKIYYFPNNRWDIKTKNNILIKLPEKNYLSALNFANNIFYNKNFENMKIIDLRISNQLIITNE